RKTLVSRKARIVGFLDLGLELGPIRQVHLHAQNLVDQGRSVRRLAEIALLYSVTDQLGDRCTLLTSELLKLTVFGGLHENLRAACSRHRLVLRLYSYHEYTVSHVLTLSVETRLCLVNAA